MRFIITLVYFNVFYSTLYVVTPVSEVDVESPSNKKKTRATVARNTAKAAKGNKGKAAALKGKDVEVKDVNADQSVGNSSDFEEIPAVGSDGTVTSAASDES